MIWSERKPANTFDTEDLWGNQPTPSQMTSEESMIGGSSSLENGDLSMEESGVEMI